jgi:hypothetical protein
MFDANDPAQLPDGEWLERPPEWFQYLCRRIAQKTDQLGEVLDALEKISPYGQAPLWATKEL